MIRLEALPPREAIEFFRQKGYAIGFNWQDVWQQEHQAAFTVAKAMQLDILRDIRSAVDAALANGTTFADFRKNLKPLLVQKGWWGKAEMADPDTGEIKKVQLGSTRRLKTIYDTNLRTAHSEGQWGRIQESKATFPYLQYSANNSEHPRLEHSAWDGLILPADHPFYQAHMPVKAWGCKCRVIQMSQGMMDRRGLSVGEAPAVPEYTYINKRSGEVQQIPKGVDPAFHYRPGGRRANLPAFVTLKLDSADTKIAQGAVRELVASDAFRKFYASPAGFFPVAVLPDEDALSLGASAHTVRLSAETMAKQASTHPEITAGEYLFVQETISNGRQIVDSDGAVVYVLEEAGYVTVVKATRTGKAVFMTSFRRLSRDQVKRDEEIRRLLRKGK